MEKIRLYDLPSSIKWVLTTYLLLTTLGFGIAALMSQNHYGFSHQQTMTFYLGDEAEGGMALPKLYSQLIQTAHVHSFTMPLVFLTVWLGLVWTPIRSRFKKIFVFGGGLSILIYNSAPFLLRYVSSKSISLFTVGGIGLFLFFLLPAILVLYETWWGFNEARR